MVQRIQCGAALLHYGAHDNAFWGVLKVGTDFALQKYSKNMAAQPI